MNSDRRVHRSQLKTSGRAAITAGVAVASRQHGVPRP